MSPALRVRYQVWNQEPDHAKEQLDLGMTLEKKEQSNSLY